MRGIAIFNLLTILREETDPTHRLSQQKLQQRMADRFGFNLNRRTIKSYLDELRAAGYPLNATVRTRILPDGTHEDTLTDFYLDPLFEVSELRLLYDLLAAMPALPLTQRIELQNKLRKLSTPAFRETGRPDLLSYLHRPPAKQLLFTVEMLCEAMQKNRMVLFHYSKYELENGTPVSIPRCAEDGSPREYFVSPYEIIVSMGRYYLVGCKEPYRDLSHYRIDRITDITILERQRLPIGALEDKPEPTAPAEQLYMYAGEQVQCRFIAEEKVLGDIIDWFGDHAAFESEGGGRIAVTVSVNPTAMEHWALQYGRWITVLEPDSLRASLAYAAKILSEKYSDLPE